MPHCPVLPGGRKRLTRDDDRALFRFRRSKTENREGTGLTPDQGYWNWKERAQFMPLPLLCPIEYC
jgi:hypothetical protein